MREKLNVKTKDLALVSVSANFCAVTIEEKTFKL